MDILGISAFYHDSAACLVRDGTIVAAAQEERFTRKKHDSAFPAHAIRYCLQEAGISADALDYVGFYEKPLIKFERLLETYLAFAPVGFASFRKALPLWLDKKLWLPREMDRALGFTKRRPYVFLTHHESHAASAFLPSPFEEAAIITMDGVGEWSTATYGRGEGNRVILTREIRFPHSVGMLYSAFTYYTGFEVNEGEYKVMGLAPYGKPVYRDLIMKALIDVKEDGSFWMDMSYFNYCQGLTMTSRKFHDLFGGPPRRPDERLTERHMDLAASVQTVTEEIMLRAARHVGKETGSRNLCLAGGVALNCVANGRILRETDFENVWIQPAAGDAGGALGVALLVWYQLLDNPRRPQRSDAQRGSLLGPAYSNETIRAFLDRAGATYELLEEDALVDRVARLMAEGHVVGWFQGRMEYGPRALGCRSIVGDARSRDMQSVMNLKVKYRESFRPFAPCVLRDHVEEYFVTRRNEDSPYMLLVAPVKEGRRLPLSDEQRALTGIDLLKAPRSVVPAVTHVDYSARIQTVDPERHGRFYRLMERFHRLTGCPVIVNTSFNLSWEPIVNRPEEAYRTFMSSDIDALVLENTLLLKRDQRANLEARAPVPAGPGIDPSLASLWRCPSCGGDLGADTAAAACRGCRQRFGRQDGIWQLYWPHEGIDGDVTEVVKQFYEEHPFPNYDDTDSLSSLIAKSRRGIYARLLAEQIGYNTRVLEVGCGTGQLANFLAIGCRTVIGTDLCMNSLRLAEDFRRRQGLSRVRFLQMNLFRPALRDGQFDVVLCNGVLHHTSDPYGGFRTVARLVKPGGHVIIGLYNRYGRLLHRARRAIFRVTGGRLKGLDPHLRTTRMSAARRDAWFADQYQHPHESKHTMGEVLRWFDETGFEFVNGIPKLRARDTFDSREELFRPAARGSRLDRAVTQARMVVTGNREGGFYIMIGRRRA
ncbi:MAG: methyltransferase domain-containing protein [Acidobacteria bacterium]|nr:methyltransferase domain-containing protein [Acidobacteriota bacterium]